MTRFWKIFITVFIVAFSANVLISYLWGIFFHDSSLQWNTTTTIAAIVAATTVSFILHKKEAREASPEEKQKKENLDKILTAVRERGTITNNDVEKLLGVSDATATRYLQSLEKEGKLLQIGTTGRSVTYKPK